MSKRRERFKKRETNRQINNREINNDNKQNTQTGKERMTKKTEGKRAFDAEKKNYIELCIYGGGGGGSGGTLKNDKNKYRERGRVKE